MSLFGKKKEETPTCCCGSAPVSEATEAFLDDPDAQDDKLARYYEYVVK